MNRASGGDLGDALRARLGNARRIAVVGVGDELSPVDRLGMVAAERIGALHLPGVRVFLAGTVPESMTGPVRRFGPDHVLILDAADMGAPAGTMAVIDPEHIAAGLLSTHALPLAVVMEFLARESAAGVTLLGIQPDLRDREGGLTGELPGSLDQNLRLVSAVLRKRQ